MKLILQQEKILMSISEAVLLQKMELNQNLQRKMLHVRKLALGASLMNSSAIVLTLAMKLCARYVRANDGLARIM